MLTIATFHSMSTPSASGQQGAPLREAVLWLGEELSSGGMVRYVRSDHMLDLVGKSNYLYPGKVTHQLCSGWY